MNKKWILSVLPFTALMGAVPAFGQQGNTLSNAVHGTTQKSYQTDSFYAKEDTSRTIASTDSTLSKLNGVWYRAGGQMPVYVPDSTLTDNMPVLKPLPVDPGMIVPLKSEADSTSARKKTGGN